ncbi:COX15/CtaA family protein [Rhizorhapis sp. SPR117]|uniref:COX15/CtaA family protein n=1 Tax=Rhizorhapis sp. SPR117 TaxID=2912611 RepID=UPI001F3118C4|nr:COX15/CtaA family protein [Rhizorhapis sp. SPR117]
MILSRPPAPSPRPRQIANWLLCIALLVFLMVVIGGITRLTESGLSITQWNPVSGAIPPLSHSDWVKEFSLYQSTTEYQTVNRHMTLAEFKFIFFWEYFHRLIGRFVGVAFALPFIWFAWKRAIPSGYGWRLAALFALGGLQGAIGWWMVASGLVNRIDVSHIRLAVHLLNAFLIMGGLVWTAWDLRALVRNPAARPARLGGFAIFIMLMLAAQLCLGAFTAGLRAGYAFDSWPLMGGRLFPQDVAMLEPLWRNIIDNPIVVQFAHRWFAWVVAGALVLLALRTQRVGSKGPAHAVMTLVGLQIILGISTLLSGVALWIAVAHQAVAALLVAATVICCHQLGRRER